MRRWRKEKVSPSFPSFDFFGVAFGRDPFRISHFPMLFSFSFSRSLWSVLAAFLDPGLLSWPGFSASALFLALSATAGCTTGDLYHNLLLPAGDQEGDFGSKTLKANSTSQHPSFKSAPHLQMALRRNWSFVLLSNVFKIMGFSLVAVFKACFFHLAINGPKVRLFQSSKSGCPKTFPPSAKKYKRFFIILQSKNEAAVLCQCLV